MRSLLSWIKRHRIWSAIILLVVVLILWAVLSPTKRDYVYESEAVSRGEVQRVVSATGKLRSPNTVQLGAEISGQVVRVYVDYNSPVRKGQVLAEIDPTRPGARVQQVQGQVALAQAALAQAEASLQRASTDVAVTQRDLTRRRDLADKGFVSRTALDAAENAAAAAQASRQAAIAAQTSARAQISQGAAELRSANLDLSRTRIISPVDGIVIDKLIEQGQTVAANFQTPNLFVIAPSTEAMQIEASVDEADIGQVSVGQDVRFTVDSFPDRTFNARVSQIRRSAVENQNVVSYLVVMPVDNSGGRLLAGMTTNVEIVTGARPNVVRAPVSALRFRPKEPDRPRPTGTPTPTPTPSATPTPRPGAPRQATVWVATDDPFKPQPRDVLVGLEGEDTVEILRGLKPGDRVLLRARDTAPDAVAADS